MYHIRKATIEDVEQIYALVYELALYEKAPHEVTNTVEQMKIDGFGDSPIFGCFVAETEGKIVGIALYYYRYSTWKGKCIYLEDIVVTQTHRGKQLGRLLLEETMRVAVAQNAQLLAWQVLDWNEPAINFYKKFGATFDDTWLNCRLSLEQMKNLLNELKK